VLEALDVRRTRILTAESVMDVIVGQLVGCVCGLSSLSWQLVWWDWKNVSGDRP